MASIEKLSIRGVRSFSPNDEEQVIQFCLPLTIIVGANGCGKTTIIESLKYVVTGSLPPGVKSGSSFVHDPRSIGQSSVKANIKLRFNNTEGSSMVVVRSMEVSQKKTTATFKALDGTIRTVNRETGERVTLSHKCTELDKSIPMYLGVSKPILEHVMFCHQEESSWPLREGAELKKRFDDIFDSTRYAKALEAIKAEKKTYAALAKDLKVELEGLNSHKFAACGFREELEDCKDKISGLDDEIKTAKEDIEKEEVSMREAHTILEKVEELDLELKEKSADIETQIAVCDKQKELLGKDDMTNKHSYQDLVAMLRDLQSSSSTSGEGGGRGGGYGNEAMRLLENKGKEYADIEREVERLRGDTNELNSRKGKLEAERDAHTSVLRERFKNMEEIHRKHNIQLDDGISQDDSDGNFTQGTSVSRMSFATTFTTSTTNTHAITREDMDAFQRALDAKFSDLTYEFEDAKKKHRSEEDAIQREIAELQAKKATIDNELQRNKSAKSQASNELRQISSLSSSLSRVRKGDVDDAKRQANELAKSRDAMNNNPRREEITKEIRVLEDRLKSLSATIEVDTKIRDQLRLRSTEQNEIDMLDRQVTQEYDILTESLRDNSYLISSHCDPVHVTRDDPIAPVEVLANSLRNKLIVAQRDVDRCVSSVGEIQKKVSEKKALLGNHKQRCNFLQNRKAFLLEADGGVQKFRSVIRALVRMDKDKIDPNQITEDSKPSDVLKYISGQVESAQAHEERPEQIEKVIKRLKKLVRNDNATPVCPCCTRAFQNEDELHAFGVKMNELADPDVSELHQLASKKSQKARESLEKYESFRGTISEQMGCVLEYNTVVEELKNVEAIIRDEEEGGYGSLKEFESQLNDEEATLSEKKELVTELQSLVTLVSGIQDTAKRVWEKMGNVKEKKAKLKYQFMGNVDDPRDLKTVEKDLSRSSDQKEAAYTDINKLNNEQKSLNEQISRITNQAATAEKTAREKEDAFNRDQESTKRKDELNEELQKLLDQDKELEKQITPLRTQLLQKESDRDRMRDINAQEDGMLGSRLKDFERDVDKLKDVNAKIRHFECSNKEGENENVDQALRQNARDIRGREERLVEMKPEIENLKKEVEDGERRKKIIQDNIDLLKVESNIKKLRKEIDKFQTELDAMNADAVRNKYNTALNNSRQYTNKIERFNGRLQGLAEQKRNLKKKLNEPEYKGVDERQRIKMIEHETTNIVVTDLDKYYDALDKALLSYHGMKINDINKIIRELWSLTYKGGDITNIEIQSGQDSASRANRSYNYRIVMSKGSTHMDMRGRCSAGQRVLASIVIRLALAETFCLNCGVMALDEPTTNLDHENKSGLAKALAQIIASRSSQSNFQLVVITHDEDFTVLMKHELAALSGFSVPEKYFQVSREEGHDGRFYSKIKAINWDDL